MFIRILRPVVALGGIALIALNVPSAHADIITTATNNSTVRTTGPRTGTSGKAFFNVEGTANGTAASLASFGVLDFPIVANPGVSLVNSLSLSLTEANAAFSLPGGLNFYVTTDTTTSIETTGPLKFITTAAPEGLDGQLTTAYLLGSGTFNTTGNVNNGQVDTYTLTSINATVQTYLLGQIQAGNPLRLIVTPTDANVAATYAGATNNTVASRPSLFISTVGGTAAVPEPGSVAMFAGMMLGGASFLVRRRK